MIATLLTLEIGWRLLAAVFLLIGAYLIVRADG